MNLFIFLLAFITITSCGHTARRSTAGAGIGDETINLSKSEMQEKMENEIKNVDEAIKVCQKRKKKLKITTPFNRYAMLAKINSQIGVDNSRNYTFTQSKWQCVAN